MSLLWYHIRRWWYKRSLAVCAYRLHELERIVQRESECIRYEEARLSQALMDLETRRHFERMARGMP